MIYNINILYIYTHRPSKNNEYPSYIVWFYMIFALKLRSKFGDFPASHDSGLEGHHVSWSIFHVFPIMNPSHFSWFDQFTTILGGWQAYLHLVFVGSTSILDWPRFHQISQLNPTTPLSHVCLNPPPGAALQPPSQGSLLGLCGKAPPHAARHTAALSAGRNGEAVHGDGADVATLATGKGDWSEGAVPVNR